MFDRTELEIAMAAVLVVAVLAGWLLHVFWLRIRRVPRTTAARLSVTTSRLLAVEQALDEARAACAEAEARAERAEASRAAVVEAARDKVTALEAEIATLQGAARLAPALRSASPREPAPTDPHPRASGR